MRVSATWEACRKKWPEDLVKCWCVWAAICSAMIVFGCPSMALAESGVASVFVVRINDRGPFVPGRIIDLTQQRRRLDSAGWRT